MTYKIIWHTDHATGALAGVYDTEKEAEKAARAWKREMVAVEATEKDRRAARAEYQWEVVETWDEHVAERRAAAAADPNNWFVPDPQDP